MEYSNLLSKPLPKATVLRDVASGKTESRARDSVKNSLRCCAGLLLALWLAVQPAYANAAGFIRDAEVEHTLREFATPIWREAGLSPSAVKIFVVQDPTLNAFVAGGQNIFLHTGLIIASTDASMLIGVMAHETGHIAGGHLARGAEQLRRAQLGTILTFVLGAAAAVGGSGSVGTAIMSGGQNIAMRNFLAFSRTQEDSADQAAIDFLEKVGVSTSGLRDLLEQLQRKEQAFSGRIDPYAITHPLSKERIIHLREAAANSHVPDGSYPTRYKAMHDRMQAKILAFIESPARVRAKYPESDQSVAARMARAILAYRLPDVNKATAEMQALIKEYPKDAFLYDLEGQILFENARVQEAVDVYAKASALAPDEPLILLAHAQAELSLGEQGRLNAIVIRIKRSIALDNSNPDAWRTLATAYGKQGKEADSELALGEEAALNNDPGVIRRHVNQALKLMKQGQPGFERAKDLLVLADQMEKDKD